MAPILKLWDNNLVNGDGRGIECHNGPDFGLHYLPNSICHALLEPNNPARYVPATAGILVIPPSQQDATVFVLDQQIHVDHRRGTADIIKNGVRQTSGRVGHMPV